MFRSTHEKILKHVFNQLPENLKEYLTLDSLIIGSKYSDNNFLLRLMMHTFEGSIDYSLTLVNEIITREHSTKDLSFKLGILTNFIQDMTCAYHSNPTYVRQFLKHRNYEKAIDQIDIETIDYSAATKITDLTHAYQEMKDYIDAYHSEDKIASPLSDLSNALSITESLMVLILKEYDDQAKINFSVDETKQRVVIFSDTYYPHINGVSNTLKQYIHYLKTNRIPYLLVCPKYDDILWEMEMGYCIYHVNAFKFIFYPSTRVSVPNRKQLMKVLDQLNPDVVHALTEFNMGYFGQKYALKRKIPFISNYSSFFHIQLKHYKLGVVEKPVARYLDWFHTQANLTTTPSQMSKDFLLENGLKNVAVFSRGVDRSMFHPKFRSEDLRKEWNALDKTVFLFSGRVSGEKDITILCDAYTKMPKAYRDQSKVVVAGDGPELEELKRTYKQIIFTGFKTGNELSKIYASADIFAFPSWSETFGNVVLEALGSGVPAIVVNQGGVLAQIKHEVNGLIVPKQDMFAFQEAMMKLIDHPELVQRYREGALKTAEERTWEKVFDQLQQDYKTLIDDFHQPN